MRNDTSKIPKLFFLNSSHQKNLSLDIGEFRYINLKKENVSHMLAQLKNNQKSNNILESIETRVSIAKKNMLRIVFPSVESVLKLLNYIYYIFN